MTTNLNGWKPDKPDHRDVFYSTLRKYTALRATLRPSKEYLLDDHFPPIYNQGNVGSCVGNGVSEELGYCLANAGHAPAPMSRLFIYYNARDHKDQDEGATIRDGIKCVAQYGACAETVWPYIESNWSVKPSDAAYAEAAHRKVGYTYYRIRSIDEIKDSIVQKYPVVFGMMVFRQFMEVGANGFVAMPGPFDRPDGGHCMVIAGFADKIRVFDQQGAFFVRNSWGGSWGYRGYCWIPYEYIRLLAADFWTVRAFAP